MTTGFSVPETERGDGEGRAGGREREREFAFHCKVSERALNCIMTALHWDFIKAIQSLVFRYCGIFCGGFGGAAS